MSRYLNLHLFYLWYYIVNCEQEDVRLAGTSYSTIGRVELCRNGTWGTVCSNSFDDIDASVVCKHLGFSPYGNFYMKFLNIVLHI